MAINTTNSQLNFRGFYNNSAQLERNALMSRGLISGVNDVMWLAMANNNDERKEKARRFAVALSLAYLTPIITLPFSNRLAMKYCSKLTDSFWANNHKLIHISNEFLKDTKSLKKGMESLSKDYSYSPFESLYYKFKGKIPEKKPLNFDEILDKCGGKNEAGYEKLRQKLINTKSGILCSDFLFSTLSFGSIGFVNNEITKKQTGKSGFSAEFSMADKEVVQKRAEAYERTKSKRIAAFVLGTLAMGISVPLVMKKGLSADKSTKFSDFVKKHGSKLDYEKGIYMSRLSMLLGAILLGHIGTLLANRNTTELKDNAIRFFAADAVILGGDVVLSSVLYKLSDKIFKTELSKPAEKPLEKILPKYKSLKEVANEVDAGKINPKNKKAALAIYWSVLASISTITGYFLPKFINYVIRKDVNKTVEEMDKEKNSYGNSRPFYELPEAFKSFK